MKSFLADKLKGSMRASFELGQRLGFDVLPRHFYSEIPDIKQLKQQQSWRRPYSMLGVEGTDVNTQFEWLESLVTDEVREALSEESIHKLASEDNGETGFGPIESDVLYSFVRTQKPDQIFQIGCGVSTSVCLQASRDAGYKPEIICIEPYPTSFINHCYD